MAASHFFNAHKEVINAIEANSTPKSTIDANKFGETLFFKLRYGVFIKFW